MEEAKIDTTNISGKAMLFGDGMNTDIIIPSKYLEYKDPKDYCKYVMAAVRPTTWQEVQDRGETIFVAGEDFGSGSSREQAPEAIKHAGVKGVIAESFATIFFRNAVNIGLPLMEIRGITNNVQEGDFLKMNLETGLVENKSQHQKYQGSVLEPFLLEKIKIGGLIPELQKYVKENNLD